MKYYTDKICHYENIVTFWIKNKYIVLKSKFRIWIDNLFTILTNIDFLLGNQH